MKMFYSKSRSGIVFMVVLAMLLQIIIPATEFVYAEENDSILIDKDFSIELGEDEEGKVTVKWEYVYRPDGKRKFNLKLGSIFEQYKEETENLMSGEIKIGEYTVSRNGEITINIDKDIETIVEGLQEKTGVEEQETIPAPVDTGETTIIDGNKG
ncbi:hypothetical protein KQI41_16850 [Tissierella pigra]|uniref:Uncharacterized protein n=1 Tax=Tissierella pigra TaxID=2607614 RepID=A0A6N7XX74_9FIRM|nr:hypothetical protein [Tissierella pigra]MBU5428063.1 hypothetical protein [Tissierella pigra]MSU02053.1 hypothetical protein [Tissierella pigra]